MAYLFLLTWPGQSFKAHPYVVWLPELSHYFCVYILFFSMIVWDIYSSHMRLDCLFFFIPNPAFSYCYYNLLLLEEKEIESLNIVNFAQETNFYPYGWSNCANNLTQNGHHLPDDNFQMHFLEWKYKNFDQYFTEVCPINNIPALVQIIAWCQLGIKPLSEPMMVVLPMHIWVTRLPQWVNGCFFNNVFLQKSGLFVVVFFCLICDLLCPLSSHLPV